MQDSIAMKKQATDRECSMDDRLSQLPQPILHHILCFLSQKEAIQTCVLSKSWRYIGSTRPKIEFRESYFLGNKATYLSVLDKILHRLHAQKLSIHEFCLEMSGYDSGSISFLEKWIPIVLLNMNTKTFSFSFLSFNWTNKAYFDLPSTVFESEPLQKLCLGGCKLKQNPIDSVILFKHLKTLSLKQVYIKDETLDMILSTCNLIEILVLNSCEGLRTVKLNKARYHNNLKLFDFRDYERLRKKDLISIEIDNVPTLETIRITNCLDWYDRHSHFPHLKSLYLKHVRLSTESFDSFSCNLPCLEELSLVYCFGFQELQLSSGSIKRLSITGIDKLIRVVIDAPNLVDFEYEGYIPRSISFKTNASEWKSRIVVRFDTSPWCFDLYEMLKALRESEISLDILRYPSWIHLNEEVLDICDVFYEPIVVDRLRLRLSSQTQFPLSSFTNHLFCICHPRNIVQFVYLNPQCEDEAKENELSFFLSEILLSEREMRRSIWKRDLEGGSMERVRDDEDKDEVRFRLKWRD